MPSSSGTYTLYTPGNPVVTGTTISSAWANNTLNDLAAAMTVRWPRDGTAPPTANMPMGAYKFTNLGAGSARTDSLNFGQVQDGGATYITGVAGTDTITGSIVTPTLAAYAAGQAFRFVAAGTNTGAATLNINSLGAKAITKNGTTALAAGDIVAGAAYAITYDGTRFQISPAVGAVALGPITTSGLTQATARMLGRTTAGTGAIEEMDAAAVSAFAAPASTSAQGVVPLATSTEMITGTNATKAVTVDAIRKGYVVRGTYTSLPVATAVDVSSLPSWMTHFEFQFNLLSTNGSSALLARIGDSGGIRISGYSGAASTVSVSSVTSVASDASGLSLIASGSGPTLTLGGIITCDLIDAVSNIWIMRSHVFYLGAGTTWVSGCTKTLPSSAMNAFRLTTVGGVDTFDAGSFNYAYW